MVEAMDWLDAMEGRSNSMPWVQFVLVLCLLVVFTTLTCGAFVYFGEMYRLVPGWGPVCKFDASASEDQQIRQHLIKNTAEQVDADRQRERVRIGLWDKDPGTVVSHPEYGAVVAHDYWQQRQAARAADPCAPRDEPTWRAQRNLTIAESYQTEFYSNVQHRLA